MINAEKVDNNLIKIYATNQTLRHIECVVYLQSFDYLKSYYKNIEIIKEYPFINAIAVRIKLNEMITLSNDEKINYISSQNLVKVQIARSKNNLNISRFYDNGLYGKGVRVAIIDTGIEPMLDFVMPMNRILIFKDFVNEKDDSYDDNGHGTFVSGVLLGNGLISCGKYSGIAPQADIISIKALDRNGEASTLKVLDAMQWVYDNKEKYNIKVVCMSFGSEPLDRNDPLSIGVDVLWQNGIVVVVAGGNSGPNESTIKSPGISKKVITVGGADLIDCNNFIIPEFSSRGPVKNFFKPDIVAPACDIISNNNKIIDGKAYVKMSGTSVATPIIAGVSALICEKYPQIKPDQVKSFIIRHGKRMGYGRNVEGFGLFLA